MKEKCVKRTVPFDTPVAKRMGVSPFAASQELRILNNCFQLYFIFTYHTMTRTQLFSSSIREEQYRHTFGTNLCRQGVPIQTASKLLGHDDISTTAKYYVNVSADEKARAIETLELNLAIPC